jgi:hypothetical protein
MYKLNKKIIIFLFFIYNYDLHKYLKYIYIFIDILLNLFINLELLFGLEENYTQLKALVNNKHSKKKKKKKSSTVKVKEVNF